MTLRRYRWGLAASLLAAASLHFAPAAGAARTPAPPEHHARAAALIDVESGRLLYSDRGDEPMKIASLTKIMTAIVAIEHGRLDDLVTVGNRAAGVEGSSLYLKAGQKMTLRNLLYGLMLRSGNDAAVAIAEHVGGSLGGFVFLMNLKAEELGLANSHFANPHGLDEKDHYSSANDLAYLTAYGLRNPVFRDIVGTKVKTAPNPDGEWDYKWVNKNKMLTMYDGADGVKTGYTKQALRTLVSSATRDGQQLAAVTLNDRNDWADHKQLLDYGFAHFPLQPVVGKGEQVQGYGFVTMNDFRYPFAAGERDRLAMRLVPLAETTPAYAFGYRGHLRFEVDGRAIGSVGLIVAPIADTNAALNTSAEPDGDRPTASASERPAAYTWAEAAAASLRALLLQSP